MFNYPHDRKKRVIQLLTEALESVKAGHIDVLRDIVVGPGADGLGLTTEKGTCFFGIEFRIATQTLQAPTPQTQKATPLQSNSTTIIKRKLTDREAESMKKGGYYHCPKCRFKTDTPRGFKKHYNKCVIK